MVRSVEGGVRIQSQFLFKFCKWFLGPKPIGVCHGGAPKGGSKGRRKKGCVWEEGWRERGGTQTHRHTGSAKSGLAQIALVPKRPPKSALTGGKGEKEGKGGKKMEKEGNGGKRMEKKGKTLFGSIAAQPTYEQPKTNKNDNTTLPHNQHISAQACFNMFNE